MSSISPKRFLHDARVGLPVPQGNRMRAAVPFQFRSARGETPAPMIPQARHCARYPRSRGWGRPLRHAASRQGSHTNATGTLQYRDPRPTHLVTVNAFPALATHEGLVTP